MFKLTDIHDNAELLANVLAENYWLTEGCFEYTLETFKENMEAIGVSVDDVYYSVSFSQGDGACFTSSHIDVERLMRSYRVWSKYRYLQDYIKHGEIIMEMVKPHHYYNHEETIYLDTKCYTGLRANEERVFREAQEMSDELEAYLKDACKELHRALVEDYLSVVSPVVVIENLEINGVVGLEADGTLIYSD